MKCPKCGFENAETALSCNMCATVLFNKVNAQPLKQDMVICPKCGYENQRGLIMCNSCNFALDSQVIEKRYKAALAALPKPTVTGCYGDAWKKLWSNFWVLLVSGIIAGLVIAVSDLPNELARALIGVFIVPQLVCGAIFVFIKAARDEKPRITDTFKPFTNLRNYLSAGLTFLLTAFLGAACYLVPITMVALLGGLLGQTLNFISPILPILVLIISISVAVIIIIVINFKLSFASYLIMDKNAGPIEAMVGSWDMTKGLVTTMFLMGLLALPVLIAGVICLLVGVIPAALWCWLAFTSLYCALSKSSIVKQTPNSTQLPFWDAGLSISFMLAFTVGLYFVKAGNFPHVNLFSQNALFSSQTKAAKLAAQPQPALNDAHAYSNRAEAKAKACDYAGELEDLNKAIELDPNVAWLYANRGDAKYSLGDNEGAIADWEKAISLEPSLKSQAQARIDQAKSKIQPPTASAPPTSTNPDDSTPDATVDEATDPAAYIERAATKYRTGNYEGAITDLTKAIELDPNNAKTYLKRGMARGDLGNYEAAIRDFDKSIKLDPNNADTYIGLGAAKGELGDYKGAVKDLERAMQLNPSLKSRVQPMINQVRKKIR